MDRIPYKPITAPYGVIDGKSYKILLRDFRWFDPVLGWIAVPKGFVFDGGSLPRLAWSVTGVTPFCNEIICAAIVHDYLYTGLKFVNTYGEIVGVTRKEADMVFLNILAYQKHLGGASRAIFYRSVRIFGGLHTLDDSPEGFTKFREDIATSILESYKEFDPDGQG